MKLQGSFDYKSVEPGDVIKWRGVSYVVLERPCSSQTEPIYWKAKARGLTNEQVETVYFRVDNNALGWEFADDGFTRWARKVRAEAGL